VNPALVRGLWFALAPGPPGVASKFIDPLQENKEGADSLPARFRSGSLALASLDRTCRDHIPTFPQRCRVGPGSFTPSRSQNPDVTLSCHPARATARRLPPSVENLSSSRYRLALSQRR
jgi:hypothetical protein